MEHRIVLERFAGEIDFPYFAKLAFNEAVMKMNMGRIFTEEEANGYFAYIIEYNNGNKDSGTYKIFLKDDNSFIGICSLRENDGSAEVEYMILPEFWGKGFATEAVGCLIEFARQNASINKISGLIDPENRQSGNVLIKNGFTLEGQMNVEEDDSVVEVYSLSL